MTQEKHELAPLSPIEPGRYRHAKGNEYDIIGVARHSETLEELVVYRALYGQHGLWVRPRTMFEETVESAGRRVPRFGFVASPVHETTRVLQHHMKAFDAGDMDAIMSDYAEDAVLLTADAVHRGPAQIRPVLAAVLTDIFAVVTEFRMLQQAAEGDVAFIVWSAEAPLFRIPMGSDTFVVRHGKIVTQTFVANIEPK